jgi:hypothetical protein
MTSIMPQSAPDCSSAGRIFLLYESSAFCTITAAGSPQNPFGSASPRETAAAIASAVVVLPMPPSP